jgi:hypothetical protein
MTNTRRDGGERSPRDEPGRAPNEGIRDRGARQGDPDADSVLPGREAGAGGQKDDGPDVTAGAGSPPGGPGGRASKP